MSQRKIEVDGEKYRYSVGSTHVKIVRDDPNTKKGFKPSTIVATHSQILGIPQETINKERSKGDRCSYYGCEFCVPSTIISVTPEKVAEFIRSCKSKPKLG